jgi:hypothetical protein
MLVSYGNEQLLEILRKQQMKPSDNKLGLLHELRENHHDISNYLATLTLSLELCTDYQDITQEEFEDLRKQVVLAARKLQNSQEILYELMKALAVEDKVDYPTSNTNEVF